jgi:hypothetical protein
MGFGATARAQIQNNVTRAASPGKGSRLIKIQDRLSGASTGRGNVHGPKQPWGHFAKFQDLDVNPFVLSTK